MELSLLKLDLRRVLVGTPLVTAGFETCFGWDALSYRWIRGVFWLGRPAPIGAGIE